MRELLIPRHVPELRRHEPGEPQLSAGVGAAATPAIVDVSCGPQAIALLRQGAKPADVVRRVRNGDADPRPVDWTREGRQFAVIDAQGNVAAYTGPQATEWAGAKQAKFCTAQGNILASAEVVNAMASASENTEGHLSLRLLAALEAGQMTSATPHSSIGGVGVGR